MKWIYATIFTDENVLLDAFESVLHRTGVLKNSIDTLYWDTSVLDALQRNLLSFLMNLM